MTSRSAWYAVHPLIQRERDAELRHQIEALHAHHQTDGFNDCKRLVLALLGESTKDEEEG